MNYCILLNCFLIQDAYLTWTYPCLSDSSLSLFRESIDIPQRTYEKRRFFPSSSYADNKNLDFNSTAALNPEVFFYNICLIRISDSDTNQAQMLALDTERP